MINNTKFKNLPLEAKIFYHWFHFRRKIMTEAFLDKDKRMLYDNAGIDMEKYRKFWPINLSLYQI